MNDILNHPVLRPVLLILGAVIAGFVVQRLLGSLFGHLASLGIGFYLARSGILFPGRS